MDRKVIPIFYACDDKFAKFTLISAYSIIKNANRKYNYNIHLLHSGISDDIVKKIKAYEDDNFRFYFHNVSDSLAHINEKLPIRDYYSKTTYYRFLIPELFPEYNKVIYTDSDTIFDADISELYNTDIGTAYLGACKDPVFTQVDLYGRYAEEVVGVNRYNIFNAGMILMNCDMFREHMVLDKFIHYLKYYNFVATQDMDYLNLICKDHVFWLDQRWNTTMFAEPTHPDEENKMIHYNMTGKPWHYRDCRCADIFWKYAEETPVYGELLDILENYSDEEKERDKNVLNSLNALVIREIERDDNFVKLRNKNERSPERLKILDKIKKYEYEGRFSEDVYDDPPTEPLLPEDIEYLDNGIKASAERKLAFALAKRFSYKLIDEKKLIIKEIKGLEKLQSLQGGAVITCNHFNEFDCFAVQITHQKANLKKKTLYTVIREGNYTSFPGFYGYLMRHCNTLPLSSNHKTMKKFMEAVNTVLSNGDHILVYPEQSLWWNYRKPKPLQKGAYIFAAKNKVPILPFFITMQDSDIIDDDGFFVQEYTVNIADPIYPDESLSYSQKVSALMDKNFEVWREIYETAYGIPLYYTARSDVINNSNIQKS